jgi:hypothetical protein
VIASTEGERDRATAVMARAFVDDPLFVAGYLDSDVVASPAGPSPR